MDNNISSSIVSISSIPLAVIEKKSYELPHTGSGSLVDITPISVVTTTPVSEIKPPVTKEDRRKIGYANLIPFKKGDKRIRGVKPKGAISTKKALEKLLKDKNVYNIANTIIKGAEQGKDKKIQTLLMLRGELDNNTQINIQNNNVNAIDSTLLQQALEYLKNNGTSS